MDVLEREKCYTTLPEHYSDVGVFSGAILGPNGSERK